MQHFPYPCELIFTQLDASQLEFCERVPCDAQGPLSALGGSWQLQVDTGDPACKLSAQLLSGQVENIALGLSWKLTGWSPASYVLIPGAVYAGNRFHSTAYPYSPPKVGPSMSSTDRTPYIGDLPRLSLEEGPSHLDQMSIDAATPGMGIYFPEQQKALLLLTPQQNSWGPFGLELLENDARDEAELRLMSPGLRHDQYFSINGGFCQESPDRGATLKPGDRIELPFQLHWVDCDSIQGLFDLLFAHRQDCFDVSPLRKEIPFSAVWDILHEKHNRENWREEFDLYQVSINSEIDTPSMLFQSGWCGGMITPYAMVQEGDDVSLQRSLRNLDLFLPDAMGQAGFFHEFYWEGQWQSQLQATWNAEGRIEIHAVNGPWTLVRRVGDVLYFICRTLLLLQERGLEQHIKGEWLDCLKRNADSIVRNWKRYGELGQYLNVDTGAVEVAGSSAGALIPAALILATRLLQEDYVTVAAEIGEQYRSHDLAQGVTCGGPGDAVQAPDSESVAALIESFVLLHEETGEGHWAQAAQDAVVQCASWALSYDYEFPEGSALQEIGAQSRGAFLANVQNKTGVPGICTLSGQGILRVFRMSGDLRFLDLLYEIAHSIPQYMGREDKAIPTRLRWGRDGVERLPPGWICERVNVTQWGEALGEISAYSCWCEVAMMLTWCDLPGVYAQPDSGLIRCLDHVEAGWDAAGKLWIHNPTGYPARVRVMIEEERDMSRALPVNMAATLPVLELAPGERRMMEHTLLVDRENA